MLVLQRHAGESVWIGDNIQVTVLGNVNGATRIGIRAPQKINIVREELRNTEVAHAVTAKTY
ncbi:MAG TPA: carbon storage regulator [Gammaproteobacteria bacterium]|nr:carbon storage regulator [Gammaproteobacteria bacterium]